MPHLNYYPYPRFYEAKYPQQLGNMAQPGEECVICGDEEKAGTLLIQAPCGKHWVCQNDIRNFFSQATQNESSFPPKCCNQTFNYHDYEKHLPENLATAYRAKECGEYSVLPKHRIYCSNSHCAKFLHPGTYKIDQVTRVTYVECDRNTCRQLTCIYCKRPYDKRNQRHVCENDENDKKFQQFVAENQYQSCNNCAAVVELIEACNHITCYCGHDFCYLCGRDWVGLHGCPHYGIAVFDEEGYNQDGYHRHTGLSRIGLTRRQELARTRGEGEEGEYYDDDDDNDDYDTEGENEYEEHGEGGEYDNNDADVEDQGEDEAGDEEWNVMQYLTREQRIAVNVLDDTARQEALDTLRIQLLETQGITFGQDPPRPSVLNPRQLHIVLLALHQVRAEIGMDIDAVRDVWESVHHDAHVSRQLSGNFAHLFAEHISLDIRPELVHLLLTVNEEQVSELAIHLNLPSLRPEQLLYFVAQLTIQIILRRPATEYEGYGDEVDGDKLDGDEADGDETDGDETDGDDIYEDAIYGDDIDRDDIDRDDTDGHEADEDEVYEDEVYEDEVYEDEVYEDEPDAIPKTPDTLDTATLMLPQHGLFALIPTYVDDTQNALFESILGHCTSQFLDAEVASQYLSSAAKLLVQQIRPFLVMVHKTSHQLVRDLVQLPVQELFGFEQMITPELDEDQAAEFLRHFARHIRIVTAQILAEEESSDESEYPNPELDAVIPAEKTLRFITAPMDPNQHLETSILMDSSRPSLSRPKRIYRSPWDDDQLDSSPETRSPIIDNAPAFLHLPFSVIHNARQQHIWNLPGSWPEGEGEEGALWGV